MQKIKIEKYELYCFEPNVQPNFNLVSFDVLIDKSKIQWGLEYRTFEYRIHSKTERFIVLILNGRTIQKPNI